MKTALNKSIGFRINKTANLLNSSFNQKLHPFGIAIEQRAILEIIKFEKDVNQTKIAEILAKDKTTISRTLKTLESKNYILKEKIDNRTNIIKLTKLGQEVIDKSEKEIKEFREKISSKFTEDEINKLFEALDKVVKAIEE